MKFLSILTLVIAGTGVLTLPARADDHDQDHHNDKKHKKHSQEYYSDPHTNVTIGVVGPHRYYSGSSSTVVIERAHPVYDDRQNYAVHSGYSGRSVEIDVQRGLSRRGYYRGTIDGDIGPGSRSAIRAFQADNGYAPTGRIDRGLLEALR